MKRVPSKGAIEEAKNTPGGWVYEIYGQYRSDEFVPPDAIIGAWKVNDVGEIIDFVENPNFKSPRGSD